jgi:hypothetical protein
VQVANGRNLRRWLHEHGVGSTPLPAFAVATGRLRTAEDECGTRTEAPGAAAPEASTSWSAEGLSWSSLRAGGSQVLPVYVPLQSAPTCVPSSPSALSISNSQPEAGPQARAGRSPARGMRSDSDVALTGVPEGDDPAGRRVGDPRQFEKVSAWVEPAGPPAATTDRSEPRNQVVTTVCCRTQISASGAVRQSPFDG